MIFVPLLWVKYSCCVCHLEQLSSYLIFRALYTMALNAIKDIYIYVLLVQNVFIKLLVCFKSSDNETYFECSQTFAASQAFD